jgi:PilZ domain-containing protein
MDEKPLRARRYARYGTDLEIIIHQDPHPIRGRITQISRGGCLIFPALPPQPTPHLRMSFRLHQELPSINCMGEIVYNIADKGTGVALTEISEYNQELITKFFEKNSPL